MSGVAATLTQPLWQLSQSGMLESTVWKNCRHSEVAGHACPTSACRPCPNHAPSHGTHAHGEAPAGLQPKPPWRKAPTRPGNPTRRSWSTPTMPRATYHAIPCLAAAQLTRTRPAGRPGRSCHSNLKCRIQTRAKGITSSSSISGARCVAVAMAADLRSRASAELAGQACGCLQGGQGASKQDRRPGCRRLAKVAAGQRRQGQRAWRRGCMSNPQPAAATAGARHARVVRQLCALQARWLGLRRGWQRTWEDAVTCQQTAGMRDDRWGQHRSIESWTRLMLPTPMPARQQCRAPSHDPRHCCNLFVH